MPEKRKAAPDQEAAPDQNQRTASIADTAAVCNYGRCPCGAAIGSNIQTLRCPTCSAWARWRSAFRVAAHAAEVQ